MCLASGKKENNSPTDGKDLLGRYDLPLKGQRAKGKGNGHSPSPPLLPFAAFCFFSHADDWAISSDLCLGCGLWHVFWPTAMPFDKCERSGSPASSFLSEIAQSMPTPLSIIQLGKRRRLPRPENKGVVGVINVLVNALPLSMSKEWNGARLHE